MGRMLMSHSWNPENKGVIPVHKKAWYLLSGSVSRPNHPPTLHDPSSLYNLSCVSNIVRVRFERRQRIGVMFGFYYFLFSS
jgi:hypothetical protein